MARLVLLGSRQGLRIDGLRFGLKWAGGRLPPALPDLSHEADVCIFSSSDSDLVFSTLPNHVEQMHMIGDNDARRLLLRVLEKARH